MRRVGDHAALLELPSNAAVHAAARLARERYCDQLVEVVPGHVTLLISWQAGYGMSDFSELAAVSVASCERSKADATGNTKSTTIPVVYDGADLDSVAQRLSTTTDEVVKLHGEPGYVVAFMGFAPGFPYLIPDQTARGVLPLLELPRLETPRTDVPAGSVAVAAGYCGIYPRSSPGGWNLIGRTESVLFDPARDPPALLEPGTRVRFEPAS